MLSTGGWYLTCVPDVGKTAPRLSLRKKGTARPPGRRLHPHLTGVSERSAGDEAGSQA